VKYPASFENLIEELKKLPAIGYKSAERLAFHILNSNNLGLINSINNIKGIKRCKKCFCLTENDICETCLDPTRDAKTLCIVQKVKDVYTIGNIPTYRGLFYVLNGVISIKNGVTPDDVGISNLIIRIKSDNINEVIIATDPTSDGELTAQFIKKQLKDVDIKVTRLAYGLPVNGNIEYADEVTLQKALSGRIIIE
jgi:recombination protein RecR